MTNLKVGLALGGGGARGYAHLGIIEALRAHNVPIDLVAGTSMGGVIGGAVACEVDLSKLEYLLKTLDLNKMLNFPKTSLLGLVGNTASEYLFQGIDWRKADTPYTEDAIEFFDLFAKKRNFEDLDVPFTVVAVDVDTGEEVHLSTGPVARAISAGIAVPGIHYPVRIGENYLVDGGLITKVPVDVAFDMGADVVIAVDVSLPTMKGGGVSSIEILMQAEAIMMKTLTRVKLETTLERYQGQVILVEPDVDDIKTFALQDVDTPKQRGKSAIERQIEEIRTLLADHTHESSN